TSAEVSPIENHLFRIGIGNLKKGVMKAKLSQPQRLTHESGWHNITMNRSCTQFIDHYSSLCVPRVQNLCNADGSLIRNIYTAQDPTLEYSYGEITLGSVKSADGKYDNYYRLIKPADFDPSKKYPLIVYVYGGPHSQMVRNTFCAELRRWEMYMAQRGYVVYVQDNRGTSNRGLDFEQAIWGQCGQAEMADQMVGVRALMELPYIDTERIGVHGWSYGGFMTISLITNYPEVFKVGVAGGPVIDWKWYEVMYGERYMGNPADNADGYAKTSLIAKAKDLKGKLLICQGVIDPVVVWENSLSFVRECVKNNVQVDYFPYPRAEHNVLGKDRVHLMDKVSIYFDDYL
ncbi:MAG: prolyl oligopeptidase family serine peptidase, partial [Bacteroidales bacterium]|nr:prolyl oligopeptidase family serine peptidase [Bacteroidales bacterium]